MKRATHVIEQRLQATRLQLLDVYGSVGGNDRDDVAPAMPITGVGLLHADCLGGCWRENDCGGLASDLCASP